MELTEEINCILRELKIPYMYWYQNVKPNCVTDSLNTRFPVSMVSEWLKYSWVAGEKKQLNVWSAAQMLWILTLYRFGFELCSQLCALCSMCVLKSTERHKAENYVSLNDVLVRNVIFFKLFASEFCFYYFQRIL